MLLLISSFAPLTGQECEFEQNKARKKKKEANTPHQTPPRTQIYTTPAAHPYNTNKKDTKNTRQDGLKTKQEIRKKANSRQDETRVNATQHNTAKLNTTELHTTHHNLRDHTTPDKTTEDMMGRCRTINMKMVAG
jgi:hypothetical protein